MPEVVPQPLSPSASPSADRRACPAEPGVDLRLGAFASEEPEV